MEPLGTGEEYTPPNSVLDRVAIRTAADRSMVRLTARQCAHRASPVLLDRFLPRSVLKCGTIMCSSRMMTEVATHGTIFSVKTDSRNTVLFEKRPIKLTKPLRSLSSAPT